MNKKADLDIDKYLSVIDWMKICHGDQLRAFTYAPYWTHPIRVASLVMKFKDFPNVFLPKSFHRVLQHMNVRGI